MNRTAVTHDGFAFDPSSDVWRIGASSGPLLFDFRDLPGASASLRAKVKAAVLAVILTRRAHMAHAVLSNVRRILRVVAAKGFPPHEVDTLTFDLVQAYRAALPPGSCQSVLLRESLTHWERTGVPGLSSDLMPLFRRVRLERHVAGLATRTCSPTRGALPDECVDRLEDGLDEALADGRLGAENFRICKLSTVFGFRPSQIGHLKACDLVPSSSPGFEVELKVPLVKKPGEPPRARFNRVGLIGLAGPMREQRDLSVAKALSEGADPANAPMFPRWRRLRDELRDAALPGLEGHLSAAAVRVRIKRGLATAGAPSDLGFEGRATPLRMRISMATSLRDAGASLAEIKAALGDDSDQVALVYIEPTPRLVIEIDDAMGPVLVPLAALFDRARRLHAKKDGGPP